MLKQRLKFYREIEKKRNSKLIVYSTSTRIGMAAQIANDILPKFTEHLDSIGDVEKISLLIYTNGGDTLTTWSLANLIRSFCKTFEIIVPANCFSSGTLLCLAADNIIMTKQAMLGPIDPSINGPLNPRLPDGSTLPVSVEHVNAYIDMAKKEMGINTSQDMSQVLMRLASAIHPLTIGQVYKSRSQIQMLAKKMINLRKKKLSPQRISSVIKFLCSDSGSHDYSIRRKEAKEELGFPIEKPSDDLYKIIKNIYDDISIDMELESPFNPRILAHTTDKFSCRRAIIESIKYGTDVFISEGSFDLKVDKVNVYTKYEGWKHE